MTNLITDIAACFNDAISDALTCDEFTEMKRRNREEYSSMGACASHDFCDANHYLIAAYEAVKGSPCELEEHDFEVMNQAFDYAHKHFFR
jgi:hypothetical protein